MKRIRPEKPCCGRARGAKKFSRFAPLHDFSSRNDLIRFKSSRVVLSQAGRIRGEFF